MQLEVIRKYRLVNENERQRSFGTAAFLNNILRAAEFSGGTRTGTEKLLWRGLAWDMFTQGRADG